MAEQQGIACPTCGEADRSEVKDSRPQPGGQRRRRLCGVCGFRFGTIEVVVAQEPIIVERVSVQGCGAAIRCRPLSASGVLTNLEIVNRALVALSREFP